jgi:hypothetical protein
MELFRHAIKSFWHAAELFWHAIKPFWHAAELFWYTIKLLRWTLEAKSNLKMEKWKKTSCLYRTYSALCFGNVRLIGV